MPCDVTVFLTIDIDHFMSHVQDKKGNSSHPCTRVSIENNMYKALTGGVSVFFRFSEGDHCQGSSMYAP